MNPYISDLLAQPSALRGLLTNYPRLILKDIDEHLRGGKFDRIIITGMGSSYNSAYPAVIRLCNQSIPVQFINAAELMHYLRGAIGARSLLWMNSQSGTKRGNCPPSRSSQRQASRLFIDLRQ